MQGLQAKLFVGSPCRKADGSEQAGSKKPKPSSTAGEDEQANLQFGRVEMGQTQGPSTKRPKKKKPSKEQLLQEAVQKQQQKADDVGDAKVPYTSRICSMLSAMLVSIVGIIVMCLSHTGLHCLSACHSENYIAVKQGICQRPGHVPKQLL